MTRLAFVTRSFAKRSLWENVQLILIPGLLNHFQRFPLPLLLSFLIFTKQQNQKRGNMVKFCATKPLKLAILFPYFTLLCSHTKRAIILLKHAASLKLQHGPHSRIPSPLLSHHTTPEVWNRPSCRLLHNYNACIKINPSTMYSQQQR